MRPRVFPAEDLAKLMARADYKCQASMRPRVFPAEDGSAGSNRDHRIRRFNEAAGIPRGRLQHLRLCLAGAATASMRPRVFPAEDFLHPLAERASEAVLQ